MRSLLLASIAGAIAITGCPGGDDDRGTCNDYSPPASFDAQNPQVSFSKDVIPIFKTSCAFTACHGLQGSNNGVFLGESGGPAAVHGNLVGRRSSKLQTMDLVKAGEPRESFVMRKLDGSHCVLDSQCTGGTCGDSMPRREETLPIEERDKIRRWIAQGAKND
jgi:hypothetical protein